MWLGNINVEVSSFISKLILTIFRISMLLITWVGRQYTVPLFMAD